MTEQPTSPTPPRGINPSAIPAELKKRPQWVCWYLKPQAKGKPKKVPMDPKTGNLAKINDPNTWDTFNQALGYFLRHQGPGCGGLGFVFTKEDPYTGVDLDKCRNPETGLIDPWALEVVLFLDSYAEISPSGTGLHIFVRGVLPPGPRKAGQIEMYDDVHYFTVTGIFLPGVSQGIESRGNELRAIHASYLGTGISGNQSTWQQKLKPATADWEPLFPVLEKAELTKADREILRRLEAGHYGKHYQLLFLGDWVRADYRSQSEADLALFNRLARLTNGIPARMFAIFRATGLMRNKINNHPSYLARTIQKAVDGLSWRPAQQTNAGEEEQC